MRCEPRFDYARATHTVERRERHRGALRRPRPATASWRCGCARRSRCRSRERRGRGRVHARRRRVGLVRPRGGASRRSRRPRRSPTITSRRLQADGELLAPLGRAQHLPGPLARDGEPLGADAEAAHLAASTARSSPRPTFGLPETIGGERNWDYRYTWIRDSSFTLYGLMRLGYTDEAAAFMRWMMARCRGAGARRLAPDHVRHRRPPRAARGDRCPTSRATWARARSASATPPTTHLQLDIYGELMDSVYLYDKYGSPIAYDAWMNIVRLIDWVCEHWRRAGRGHLGGARRAPGVPLLAGDVLGGASTAPSGSRASARSRPRWRAGTRRATRSTATSSSASGTRRAAAFVQHAGRAPRSTPRRC